MRSKFLLAMAAFVMTFTIGCSGGSDEVITPDVDAMEAAQAEMEAYTEKTNSEQNQEG